VLAALRNWVRRIWQKWLARRSNRPWPWERMDRALAVFPLPPARAMHSILSRSKPIA
jgi:hypothetical protein